MYPTVAIGIITYNRLDTLLDVIASMREHIKYPNLVWVLSDDGSNDDTVAQAHELGIFERILTNNRLGMGGNWNQMITNCEQLADYTLCCQDDWLFTCPVDLRLAVQFLNANPEYGMLRYHKLTGHVGLAAIMREWDTRQAFKGFSYNADNEYAPHMLPYLELLPAFDNIDVYSPFSGGVHLRHRRFTQCYGQYIDRVGFSHSELEYQARVNQGLRHNLNVVQRVAMFPEFIPSRFRDLGDSYRGTATEAETID